MLQSTLRFRSIASSLIQRIVLLAVLCLAAMSGLQAYLGYRESVHNIDRAVKEVADNSLPMLSSSLWDIEPQVIQRQVNWLSSLPEIGRVRVVASTGQVFEAGSHSLDQSPASHLLEIAAPQGSAPVGRLELWVEPDYVLSQMIRNILNSVMGYLLFSTLLCVVLSLILKRDLGVPLRQIADFASGLKPHELSRPLIINRPQRPHQDEIDLVCAGFRQLQGDLQNHIANLDSMVAERTQQLERLIEEVHRLSITDALTGCFNRRVIEERLPAEIERARRYGRSLSIIFADIDYFKAINDELGHAAGDLVLREVAAVFLGQLRSQVDWVARYGGEEFLIVLPESDLEKATGAAERLRELIAAQPLFCDGRMVKLTVSFGVAQCAPDEGTADLLSRADAMLYHAKAEGRNRVKVSG
jgi:diguanylate cyclase (GGDEF)-like protein